MKWVFFWGKTRYLCGMEQLLQQIEQYKQEITSIIPDGAEALEAYRIRFLGTKGIVKNLFTEMKNVPADQKKEFGPLESPRDLIALPGRRFDRGKNCPDRQGLSYARIDHQQRSFM